MTVGDLNFDPAKHLVNGKLRPPDKCEQAFIVHFAHRGAVPIGKNNSRVSVYLLYQEWWYGWRSMLGPCTEFVAEAGHFKEYWKANLPEGYKE